MNFPLIQLMGAIEIKPMEFVKSLRYMGEGMLGIFLVMLVIIGAICALNAVFGKKK